MERNLYFWENVSAPGGCYDRIDLIKMFNYNELQFSQDIGTKFADEYPCNLKIAPLNFQAAWERGSRMALIQGFPGVSHGGAERKLY